MQSFKLDRVSQLLIETINTLIVMGKIKDPRVSSRVSVVHVKISKDLSAATVYISSFLEDKTLNNTVEALNHARGYIQSEIHKIHNWKNTPKLLFKSSNSLKKSEHIKTLLDSKSSVLSQEEIINYIQDDSTR